MFIDKMQQQRFELKYLINEETALQIRDFVQCYLNIDEYSISQPNLSYHVHSIYLDNDYLQTYWETINGQKNRFKLRMRFYSTKPGAPIFFEIKRRMNNIIMKQRGGVKQEFVPMLLQGHLPEPHHLISFSDKSFIALQNFCELMSKINARPRVHIHYLREAYLNDDGSVRLTMDRSVISEPHLDYTAKTDMANPRLCYHGLGKNYVILELKFTNRFPNWMRELVRIFHCVQRGAAKYCSAIQVWGEKAVDAKVPVAQDEENWVEGMT
ncbi:MAG: VTC domain-containing protein [Verrucomicrobiia bacterium]|jgi:hypothetical protein